MTPHPNPTTMSLMPPDHQLPQSHLPVVDVNADTLDERNWRRVSVGEPVRAFHQALILMPPNAGWRLSCFVKADGQKVTGRTAYRSPRTLRAWWSVALPAARKVVAHWFARKPSSP